MSVCFLKGGNSLKTVNENARRAKEKKMTKRQYQIDAFKINTERNNYVVTLERLKNDTNGNPRYKAVIIFVEENTESYYNAVYTFTGHYLNGLGEAKWIVEYYEAETNK